MNIWVISEGRLPHTFWRTEASAAGINEHVWSAHKEHSTQRIPDPDPADWKLPECCKYYVSEPQNVCVKPVLVQQVLLHSPSAFTTEDRCLVSLYVYVFVFFVCVHMRSCVCLHSCIPFSVSCPMPFEPNDGFSLNVVQMSWHSKLTYLTLYSMNAVDMHLIDVVSARHLI